MNERDFCYWLTGFVELTQDQTPNPAQWKSIKGHLDLVFKKVTPPVGETKTTGKVEIDAKDAEKTIEDLRKAYDELAEKVKKSPFHGDGRLPGQFPFYDWPSSPLVVC